MQRSLVGSEMCIRDSVMAANGYPGNYAKGSVIRGLEDLTETSFEICFHAGTQQDGTNIVATGGRVLNLTARSEACKTPAKKPMPWQIKSIGLRDFYAETSAGGRYKLY